MVDKTNWKPNKFDGAIPGQSWTKEKGSYKWQSPAQFDDPNKALEYTFDQMLKPKNAAQMRMILEQGAPAEAVARTILAGGFAQGKWTPDTAHIMAPIVQAQVVAVAHKMGVKNMKFSNPDKEFDQNMSKYQVMKDLQAAKEAMKKDNSKPVDEEMPIKQNPNKPSFGGII